MGSIVKLVVLLVIVTVMCEARDCGFRWRGKCPEKRHAKRVTELELEAGIEAYQGELEGAKSGDIMDEIVNWSDEELATNLQTELMEILKKRDTIRNK